MSYLSSQDQNKLALSILKSQFISNPQGAKSTEKIQKTKNPAFGTLQQFLDFIVKKTPETIVVFKKLKALDLDCKQDQFQDLIQVVIRCIQNAAESNDKATKSRGLSFGNPIQEGKNIVAEIETKCNNPDLTLRAFLKLVLKIYTMKNFVCYWLNELLRSEDWVQINVLAPYLIYLVYTFQIKDFIIQDQEPRGVKLKLYRGATLTKQDLDVYLSGNKNLFSWNGVTSTSRSKEEAVKFANHSGERIGVLFMIEIDLATAAGREGVIDISKDSASPGEQEVILAPGSVFEVIGYSLDEHRHEVRLALRKEFKDHKTLGDLQSEIICGNKAVLNGLSYDEITKALNLLEGDQVVESLKIENCELDGHLMELIGNMRRTTNIKEENIEFTNNRITSGGIRMVCHAFAVRNLGQLSEKNDVIGKDDSQNNGNGKLKNYLHHVTGWLRGTAQSLYKFLRYQPMFLII